MAKSRMHNELVAKAQSMQLKQVVVEEKKKEEEDTMAPQDEQLNTSIHVAEHVQSIETRSGSFVPSPSAPQPTSLNSTTMTTLLDESSSTAMPGSPTSLNSTTM